MKQVPYKRNFLIKTITLAYGSTGIYKPSSTEKVKRQVMEDGLTGLLHTGSHK